MTTGRTLTTIMTTRLTMLPRPITITGPGLTTATALTAVTLTGRTLTTTMATSPITITGRTLTTTMTTSPITITGPVGTVTGTRATTITGLAGTAMVPPMVPGG